MAAGFLSAARKVAQAPCCDHHLWETWKMGHRFMVRQFYCYFSIRLYVWKNTRISLNGNFNDLQTVKLVTYLFLCLHACVKCISGLNIKVECVRQHVLDMKDPSNHMSCCNASATKQNTPESTQQQPIQLPRATKKLHSNALTKIQNTLETA